MGEMDRLLIMTVVPGKTGQKFIPGPLAKMKEARQLIDKHGYRCELAVDGGVNLETAPSVIEAGVDVVISGAGILYQPDMIKAVDDFRKLAEKYYEYFFDDDFKTYRKACFRSDVYQYQMPAYLMPA